MAVKDGIYKRYLVLTTLDEKSSAVETVRRELEERIEDVEIISTAGKRIHHCIGCNACWIKTPGICCIKDDYEPVFLKILQADFVILLTETKYGFINSGMKNVIDRILPIATMHLKMKNGRMCHYLRYNQAPDLSLIYLGEADDGFLGRWLERVQNNLHRKSAGAYEFDRRKELYHALGYH